MDSSLPKPLRISLIGVGITLAIAGFTAVVLLGIVQFLPEEFSSGRIQWGDYSTPLAGVFSGGFIEFVIAFAVVTLAVLVAALAVLIAVVVTALVLAVTAGALLLSAIVVALPLIVVVAFTWWLVRHSSRQRQTVAI